MHSGGGSGRRTGKPTAPKSSGLPKSDKEKAARLQAASKARAEQAQRDREVRKQKEQQEQAETAEEQERLRGQMHGASQGRSNTSATAAAERKHGGAPTNASASNGADASEEQLEREAAEHASGKGAAASVSFQTQQSSGAAPMAANRPTKQPSATAGAAKPSVAERAAAFSTTTPSPDPAAAAAAAARAAEAAVLAQQGAAKGAPPPLASVAAAEAEGEARVSSANTVAKQAAQIRIEAAAKAQAAEEAKHAKNEEERKKADDETAAHRAETAAAVAKARAAGATAGAAPLGTPPAGPAATGATAAGSAGNGVGSSGGNGAAGIPASELELTTKREKVLQEIIDSAYRKILPAENMPALQQAMQNVLTTILRTDRTTKNPFSYDQANPQQKNDISRLIANIALSQIPPKEVAHNVLNQGVWDQVITAMHDPSSTLHPLLQPLRKTPTQQQAAAKEAATEAITKASLYIWEYANKKYKGSNFGSSLDGERNNDQYRAITLAAESANAALSKFLLAHPEEANQAHRRIVNLIFPGALNEANTPKDFTAEQGALAKSWAGVTENLKDLKAQAAAQQQARVALDTASLWIWEKANNKFDVTRNYGVIPPTGADTGNYNTITNAAQNAQEALIKFLLKHPTATDIHKQIMQFIFQDKGGAFSAPPPSFTGEMLTDWGTVTTALAGLSQAAEQQLQATNSAAEKAKAAAATARAGAGAPAAAAAAAAGGDG